MVIVVSVTLTAKKVYLIKGYLKVVKSTITS